MSRVTLTAADYARTEPSYAWRCASCARLFATNRSPDPPRPNGRDWINGVDGVPIDATATREAALLCCAADAQDYPALNAGFWTRPAPGALAVRVTTRAIRIERRPLALALVFVARGDSEVWSAPSSRESDHSTLGDPAYDTGARITGYRLDVFIDEDRENRRDFFTTLLAGLRLHVRAGEQSQSPLNGYTLVRLGDADDPDEDVMFHAGVSPTVDLVVPFRQGFSVRLAYGLAPGLGGRPSPIPIGFMRVVVLGETTRDVD